MRRSAFLLLLPFCLVACADEVRTPAGPASLEARLTRDGVPENFQVHLDGDGEVPARPTLAQGNAKFQLAPDGGSIEYTLIASNIENVIQAHIHLGGPTVNGPVVVFLYGLVPPGAGRTDGVLARGTIVASQFRGPLAGQPLSALLDAIRAGNTYVNVHTSSGVAGAPLAPGNFPGGEVRGQIDHGSLFH